MIYLAIPAVSISVLLALGAKEWLMGRRAEALHYFDRCATVLIMLGVIWGLAWIGGIVSSKIYGKEIDVYNLADVTNTLSDAGNKFEEMQKTAVDWVVKIGLLRASTAAVPFLHPLSEVLGSVLLWQNWAFSIAATSLLVMVIITRFLAVAANWLLCIGATLTATDTLRRIGAGLLALYLTTVIGLPVIAEYTYSIYRQTPQPPDTGLGNTPSVTTTGSLKLNLTAPDEVSIGVEDTVNIGIIVRGMVPHVDLSLSTIPEPEPTELYINLHPTEGSPPFNSTLYVSTSPQATLGAYYTITIEARGNGEFVSKSLRLKITESSGGGEERRIVLLTDLAAEAAWSLLSATVLSGIGLSIVGVCSAGLALALGGVGTISIRRYV